MGRVPCPPAPVEWRRGTSSDGRSVRGGCKPRPPFAEHPVLARRVRSEYASSQANCALWPRNDPTTRELDLHVVSCLQSRRKPVVEAHPAGIGCVIYDLLRVPGRSAIMKPILKSAILLAGLAIGFVAALRLTDLIERVVCEQEPSQPRVTCDLAPLDKLWMALAIVALVAVAGWGARTFLRAGTARRQS